MATCGAIARALGDVRAARSVASWLTHHPRTKGGHRVVRSDGRPVLDAAIGQLATEGLRVGRGRVDRTRFVEALRSVPFLDLLRDEQRRLSANVIEKDLHRRIESIVGVDASYHDDKAWAAAASIEVEGLSVREIAVVRVRVDFPYIPTYLAYRELPAIEDAVRRLTKRPDAVMVDGHGRLHPAEFGVACHVGLRLDVPTIGIAKHLLTGRARANRRRGEAARVEVAGKTRGYAWTPPGAQRPIFVSIGHRFSLEGALDLVQRVTQAASPEPIRIADRISREMRRNEKREKGATR